MTSRISLDPAVRDLFGDPVPHLSLAFTSNLFGAHHRGTCRMSEDPDRGVVDRDCRVHGVSNLYAVFGSVFPSGGALQPSLTIAALALRMADHLWPV